MSGEPPDLRSDLERAAELTSEFERRLEANPLDHIDWLPGQYEFLTAADKKKAFRAGNQAQGKTWAGAAELIWRMLGTHPFRQVREPPIRGFVVCGAGEQGQIVQEKVWDLVPKDMVAEGCAYDPMKGAFIGKYPKLVLKNGSVCHFKTGRSDTVNLASATLDVVWIDEPPASSRVWTELLKRVLRKNGDIYITFTPVNAPVEWLKKECEEGRIRDIHYPLKPEHMIPVGKNEPIQLEDGTVCDAEWVKRVREETLPHEVPVVVDGEWEMRLEGNVFRAFKAAGPASHVHDRLPESDDIKIVLGIDHGIRTFKEVAVLLAVDDSGEYPRIWGIDEYVSDGETTTEQDAAAIRAMLKRNGLTWKDLTYVYGDKKHDGGRKGVAVKTNKHLEAEIAKQLGLPKRTPLKPGIRQAKTGKHGGAGSKGLGCTFIHQAQLRPGHFNVHPCMARSIECFQKWDYSDASDWKDAIDAWRYALWPWTVRRARRGPVVGIR